MRRNRTPAAISPRGTLVTVRLSDSMTDTTRLDTPVPQIFEISIPALKIMDTTETIGEQCGAVTRMVTELRMRTGEQGTFTTVFMGTTIQGQCEEIGSGTMPTKPVRKTSTMGIGPI